MKSVTLNLKQQPDLFLEVECLTPDTFAGKKLAEIEKLPVYQGKEDKTLGEYFSVAGESGATAADTQIVVNGDCSKVKYIGAKMTAGEVIVNSTTDMYTGAWMKGGRIVVNGDVHSFCGLGMEGGEFIIEGNAGNFLGASYRGDWRGMQGGLIRVKGNVGSDIGSFMRGGEMIIGGNADIHIATHAEGGRIVIKGNVNRRIGGQMVKGEVIVFGTVNVMMPGFKYVRDVELNVDGTTAQFNEFIGDLGERHPKRKGETVYGKLFLRK
ncbi:MAG: formylmethanofuran dehydrogenase subunit C [Methanoregulaceae archaeon]|nr:formylmethanofuran dehydrogenase subunit C [Methanoregulaceae archaeon]